MSRWVGAAGCRGAACPSGSRGGLLCLVCAQTELPIWGPFLVVQDWLIPPEEVEYLRRPKGDRFVLGEGAR